MLALQFARSYGMHVVAPATSIISGPGRRRTSPSRPFARQLAEAKKSGGRRPTLLVGHLEPVRDFSHVSDVVAAYELLLEAGARGEAYNVCSGVGRTIRNTLDELIALAGIDVDVEVDPARVRPTEVPALVGDPGKIRSLGWTPRRTVHDALREVLEEAGRRP